MAGPVPFGIIGGTGLYNMPGLLDREELDLDTPFGKPSAPVLVGNLNGARLAFLARHGIGHNIQPSDINYRANIYALKSLGVERIVSISACGSLRGQYAPGNIVIPDQLFDFTKGRARTFFNEGLVAHIGVADPFCNDLSDQLDHALQRSGAVAHRGGAFITIEGPRFSTRAESNTFRTWGMSIIGMTTSPEAFLAREAEICYAVMAHVTDYDVWHFSEAPVSIEVVNQILTKNTEAAEKTILLLVESLKSERNCDCGRALSGALLTKPESLPASTSQKLGLIVGKYYK